jgi:hypothetical protein
MICWFLGSSTLFFFICIGYAERIIIMNVKDEPEISWKETIAVYLKV